MSWLKNPWIFNFAPARAFANFAPARAFANCTPARAFARLALAGAFAACAGCGVKGDPLPPEKPPRMGRGKPTYRRATERIKLNEKDVEDEEQN